MASVIVAQSGGAAGARSRQACHDESSIKRQIRVTGFALCEKDRKASASPGMWYYTCPDELWVEGTAVSTNPGDRTITLHCVADCDAWWWYCDPMYWEWYQWGFWAPYWGMEWEFQKQVNLTVLPREGTSEAQLKLYSSPPGSGEAGLLSETEPIGGTVYPVLYLTIGPGERIAGGTTQSVIRVHDTYTGYWAGTPVNCEAIADLTSTNYWQVWNGTAWVTAGVAPALKLQVQCPHCGKIGVNRPPRRAQWGVL